MVEEVGVGFAVLDVRGEVVDPVGHPRPLQLSVIESVATVSRAVGQIILQLFVVLHVSWGVNRARLAHSHWSRSDEILCSDWSKSSCYVSSLMPLRTSSRHPKSPTRGISCLSLVLYGIRIGSEGLDLCHKEPAKGKKCP